MMSRWTKVLLIAVLLGSGMLPCRAAPVVSKAAEQEQALLRERRDYLRNALVQRKEAFKAGRLTQEGLLDAARLLFQAELELAGTPGDRASLCDDFAAEVHKQREAVEAARKAGRLTDLEYARQLLACCEDEILIHRERRYPASDKDASRRLLLLRRNRLEAAQAMLLSMEDAIKGVQVSFAVAERATRTAAEARLHLTEKADDRLRIFEKQIDQLARLEKVVQAQFEAGRVSRPDQQEAHAASLAAQIALAREKSSGGPPPEQLRKHLELRLEVLAGRQKQYEFGRYPLDGLLYALDACLEARLALADSKDERLAALRTHLDAVKKIEATTKARIEAAFLPQADYETLCALRLGIQLRLLRAEHDRK
jgi:hypothetical protein